MKTKLRLILTTLCLISLFFVLTACGGDDTVPSSPPTASPAPDAADPAASPADVPPASTETFSFIVSSFAGEGDTAGQFVSQACDRITQRTGGRIIFTKYLNSELGTPTDMLEMVRAGTTDIAQLSATFASNTEYPLSQIVTMPFYVADNFVGTDILYALIDAGLMTEYGGEVHLLYLNGIDGDFLFTTKSPVETAADLKGKLIRAQGGGVDMIEALGGSPVTIASSELYKLAGARRGGWGHYRFYQRL